MVLGIKKPTKIKLGQKVRDTITGFEGIAVARTEWMYGCVRVTLQPEGGKDGVPFEPFVVDEPQLEKVKPPRPAPKVRPTHGPRDDPGRAVVETDLATDSELGDREYQVPERSK